MPWTIDIPEPQTKTDNYAKELAGDLAGNPLTHPDHARGGFAELSEVYRQLGFDAGYGQAARDQLEYSVVTAEQVLKEHGTSATNPTDARRLLYAFIARIDRRLGLFANQATSQGQDGYMEGGLGI